LSDGAELSRTWLSVFCSIISAILTIKHKTTDNEVLAGFDPGQKVGEVGFGLCDFDRDSHNNFFAVFSGCLVRRIGAISMSGQWVDHLTSDKQYLSEVRSRTLVENHVKCAPIQSSDRIWKPTELGLMLNPAAS
jgi:hypothetical protein